jgi:hypothetical protein
MEFRWIAVLALWTLIAGPMFDSPLQVSKSQQVRSDQAAKHRTTTSTNRN